MTRALFLFLSQQRTLRRLVEKSPLSRKLTKRFVAGETLDEEVAVCRNLSREHIFSSIDRLGENVSSLKEAEASRDAYLEVIDRIEQASLPSTVSIKLTQFGLDFSTEACFQNVRQLVARARRIDATIEIDMESSDYTDRTLDIVKRLHKDAGGVRAVVQAYLRRTRADIERLSKLGIPARLCKGAYDEPPSVAFATKREVDVNYVELTKLLLDFGSYPAIATHDDAMVAATLEHVKNKAITPDRFEFQMLYGIRRDMQKRLVGQGFRLRIYVPYGDAWYPYFMRRLAERPANVFFLLRNLLRA